MQSNMASPRTRRRWRNVPTPPYVVNATLDEIEVPIQTFEPS